MSSQHRREESKIHDRAGCSLAHIRPQIPVIISAIFTACYVLGNSVTIFFFQNKSTAPRILGSAFCFRISEIALGFRPMRNRKIFQRIISGYWMRSSMIWRILQIEVGVMRLIGMSVHIHTKASWSRWFLLPFFFLSICFKLENKLTSIYVKLPSS